MSRCGWCGGEFVPGDQIELSEKLLPAGLGAMAGMLKSMIGPHLSRVKAYRCQAPGCGGLHTILYLPPAPPAPHGVSGGSDPATGG